MPLVLRARAATAGLAVGTLPMIWSSLVASGGLSLRPSHVFGLITLLLVALSGARSQVPMRSVVSASLIAGFVVLGVAANAAWFDTAFWPTSEVIRFGVNVAIGLGVAAVVADLDHRDGAWFLAASFAGIGTAIAIWVAALAATPIGLGGLVAAAGRGDSRAVLFDAHLPAIRSLQGEGVLLGARHGAIFGFLTALAFIHIAWGHITSSSDDDADRVTVRRDPRATMVSIVSLAVVLLTVLSLSRSGIVALLIGGGVWLVVKREDLLWNAWVYVGGAALVGVGLTSLAGGLNERLFQDTDSLTSRQTNLSEVLEADWTVFGSPRLADDVDSPHNMVVEFAAAGGVPTLLAAIMIVAIVGLGLVTMTRRSPAVTLLAVVVLVRLLSAARGSLDTAGVVALLSFVALDQIAAERRDQSAIANTSWSDESNAWPTETRRPRRPLSVSS